jgi:peptidoglycan/xylan/chitin deacetylase (PgdA/CDA1 family)
LNTSNIQHVPILTFHKIEPVFEWGVTRITPKQFRTVLDFLKTKGYQTISLEQLCNVKNRLANKPIILTFDDAYESFYKFALPLLLDYQYTGTLFVISRYVNCWNAWDVNLGGKRFKHLSWDKLAELSKMGFEIGSHGMYHKDFTQMNDQHLYAELMLSKKEIEDHIGQKVHFLSFPFGRYNKRVIEAAKACGYQKACGYFRKKHIHEKNEEMFVLERKAYYLFDTKWNLKAKIEPSLWKCFENLKLRLVNFGSYGTLLLKKTE